jgi:hypothetical protein
MDDDQNIQERVACEVEACLRKLGFEPETRSSRHDVLVHARKMVGDECVRVVLHISDKEPLSYGSGAAHPELDRTRLAQIAVRPTLAAQTASRFMDIPPGGTNSCS